MIDKKGTQVIRGSILRNQFFGEHSATMTCIGYDYKDGKVLLRQDRSGEVESKLTQAQLIFSQWQVVGHKPLPDIQVNL